MHWGVSPPSPVQDGRLPFTWCSQGAMVYGRQPLDRHSTRLVDVSHIYSLHTSQLSGLLKLLPGSLSNLTYKLLTPKLPCEDVLPKETFKIRSVFTMIRLTHMHTFRMLLTNVGVIEAPCDQSLFGPEVPGSWRIATLASKKKLEKSKIRFRPSMLLTWKKNRPGMSQFLHPCSRSLQD